MRRTYHVRRTVQADDGVLAPQVARYDALNASRPGGQRGATEAPTPRSAHASSFDVNETLLDLTTLDGV
jgi:hypothetical protein